MVSLLQRFHCTGQLTVVPMVSLLQRFHCNINCQLVPRYKSQYHPMVMYYTAGTHYKEHSYSEPLHVVNKFTMIYLCPMKF